MYDQPLIEGVLQFFPQVGVTDSLNSAVCSAGFPLGLFSYCTHDPEKQKKLVENFLKRMNSTQEIKLHDKRTLKCKIKSD